MCITVSGDEKAKEEKAEAHEVVKQFRTMAGLEDPDDADWLHLDKLDHKTGTREPMGSILLSIEVLPLAMAETRPAGFGRSDPNSNPFLPQPVGRLKFVS